MANKKYDAMPCHTMPYHAIPSDLQTHHIINIHNYYASTHTGIEAYIPNRPDVWVYPYLACGTSQLM